MEVESGMYRFMLLSPFEDNLSQVNNAFGAVLWSELFGIARLMTLHGNSPRYATRDRVTLQQDRPLQS